jgi:hypothetical protein
LDHVIPINYFKKFSCASKYLAIRDSWINIMHILAIDNFTKYSKVYFSLFEVQLKKAKLFINNYNFPSVCEKTDTIYNYEYIKVMYMN